MIPEINPYNNYLGDGSATKFDFDFYIQDSSQLIVEKIDKNGVVVRLVENVDYEIKDIGNKDGGYIVFPIATSGQSILSNDDTISLQLSLPFEQVSEYGQSSLLDLNSIEFSLDYLTRLCQILKRQLERSVKAHEGDDNINIVLPPPKANNTFAWNEDCSALVNYDIIGENNSFKTEMINNFQNAKNEFDATIATNKQEILDTQSEFQQQTNTSIKEFEDGIDAKIETVADAADRINNLDADLAIATNAANEAISQAQTAAQQAQIATEKVEEIANAKEEVLNVAQDITESNEQFKNEIEAGLENKANTDLSNLSEVGEKHFLNKSQITNCITEIPQRIKLELADGVLTLKAGSEVIVPNGFEADGTTLKFDYVTIKEDIVRNAVGFANSNSSLVFFSPDTNIIFDRSEEICFSGTTTPTGSYATWYDSNTNTIKNTNTSGSTWTSGYSLPFALVKSNDNSFASIEQTFNALGYMGSSFWINKDVKVLLRNGKNEDGTYKNIEFTVPKIQVRTTKETSAIGYKLVIHEDQGGGCFAGWWDGRVFEQVEEPTIWSYGGSLWINPETNISKYHPEDDNADWVELPSAIIGTGNRLEGGKVGNFKVKQAFRAIDYNDKVAIGSWAMPSNKYIDLTLGASNTVYIAPANGWVWLQMQSAAAGQGVSLHSLPTPSAASSSACITSRVYSSATTQYLATNIPVRKGQSFVASYTASGTAGKYFRFCYAESEV